MPRSVPDSKVISGTNVDAEGRFDAMSLDNIRKVDGAPYNCIHFEGQNPVHSSETMRELSSQQVRQRGLALAR